MSVPKTNNKTIQTRSKQSFSFPKKYMHIYSKSFHSEYISSNAYLITSNESNAKLHYNSAFFFLRRNTDDSTLPSCRYIQLHLRTMKTCPMENIHWKAQSHCSHHCPKDPRRSSEKFLHKNKRFFRWTFSLPRNASQGTQTDYDKTCEAAMSNKDGTSKAQASGDVPPSTLCSKEEVGALEEGVLHRHPDE